MNTMVHYKEALAQRA